MTNQEKINTWFIVWIVLKSSTNCIPTYESIWDTTCTVQLDSFKFLSI